MSGIGNSIETDLVGEVIELVRLRKGNVPWPYARGLCRAVTSDGGGGLYLWLEIRDAKDVELSDQHGYSKPSIGDVILASTDDGGEPIRMRLVKTP